VDRLIDKLEKRGDWWWPIGDQGCWNYMHQHSDVVDHLCEYVAERKVVVQAGGNAGFYIRKYAEQFERVYTFEPEPLNFLALSMNCDYPNVVKFNAAVGDAHRFIALNHHAHDVGATHVQGMGTIPTFKIDDLELDRCDLIQLDTEGYEYFGLLGAKETIDKFKPVISIEWFGPWAERYGVTFSMIEEFLAQWNYEHVATHATDLVYVSK
jgi:FkbM family methyltransferase